MRTHPTSTWLLIAIWLLPICGVVWSVAHAPTWLEPRTLTLQLAPGQEMTLGRETLAALHADSAHLQIRRTAEHTWQLINLADRKAVLWQGADRELAQSTREWPLSVGGVFSIGTQRFEMLRSKPHKLLLQHQQQQWQYDGFNLRRNGNPLPECQDNWRSTLRHYLRWVPRVRSTWQRPLRLGGGVYCADRLGLPGIAVDSAWVVSNGDRFILRPGPGTTKEPLILTFTSTTEALWQRSIALSVGDTLVIGRTRYQVTATTPALQLALITRAWYRRAADLPPEPTAVTINWQPVSLWWPSVRYGVATFCTLLGAALLLSRRPATSSMAAIAAAGAALVCYWHSATLPILWAYALLWYILGRWLLAVRALWSQILLAVGTLLFGMGLIAALQLALGAGESGWSRYGGGNAALAATVGYLAWALRSNRYAQNMWHHLRCAVYLLGATTMMLLLAQILGGDESGWGGFQPFELAKLALVVSSAYVIAGASRELVAQRRRCWQTLCYLRSLLLLAALLLMSAFAMIFLRDFSPLLIIGVWGLGLGWAAAALHHNAWWRYSGRAVVIALLSAAIGGLALLHQQPNWFPFALQAERVQVWAAPQQHPHTGYQVRRARQAIHMAGWSGSVWDAPENGRIMTLPALQDDFMPSFALQRYGGGLALLLAALQGAYIGTLLHMGRRAYARDGADKLNKFIYLSLYGAAAIIAAHFVVAWGSNLGFLPVMGQPMSFLSAAGSHLTLLLIPVLALAVASEETLHGNPS